MGKGGVKQFMVNDRRVKEFLDYNYMPFNRIQCIKRLFIVWIMSTILCFIGKPLALWIVSVVLFNISLSVLFAVLIFKYSISPISRYLCDGTFFLYISVILNLSSYRVIVLLSSSNYMLAILLMVLLIICILLFTLIAISSIKNGKYSTTKNRSKHSFWPYVGAACGVFIAPFILQRQSQNEVLLLISYCLLILSFLTSIASVNLLKALLYRRYIDKRYIEQQ